MKLTRKCNSSAKKGVQSILSRRTLRSSLSIHLAGAHISFSFFGAKTPRPPGDSESAVDQPTTKPDNFVAQSPPPSKTIDETIVRHRPLQEVARESSTMESALCHAETYSTMAVDRGSAPPQNAPGSAGAYSTPSDKVQALKRKAKAMDQQEKGLKSVTALALGGVKAIPFPNPKADPSVRCDDNEGNKKVKYFEHTAATLSPSSNPFTAMCDIKGQLASAVPGHVSVNNAKPTASQELRVSEVASSAATPALKGQPSKKQSRERMKRPNQITSQSRLTAKTSYSPTGPQESPNNKLVPIPPKPPQSPPPNALPITPEAPKPKKRRHLEVRALTAPETTALLQARRPFFEAMKRPDVEMVARQLGVYWPGATKAGQIDRIVEWQVGCGAAAEEPPVGAPAPDVDGANGFAGRRAGGT